MKKTVVLGATTNPARAAFAAVERMVRKGVEVIPVGIRKGEVAGVAIRNDLPAPAGVHTVTLYLGSPRQSQYYDYILKELQPKRLIFNPGTENPELAHLARESGIEVEIACTLVMLSMGTY